MWSEWTADGQSIGGWLCVQIALWIWLNFYLTFNKNNKFAVYGTAFGIFANACVLATVVLFRYVLVK